MYTNVHKNGVVNNVIINFIVGEALIKIALIHTLGLL